MLRDLEVSIEERLHPLTYERAAQYKQISGFFLKAAAAPPSKNHDPRQQRLVMGDIADGHKGKGMRTSTVRRSPASGLLETKQQFLDFYKDLVEWDKALSAEDTTDTDEAVQKRPRLEQVDRHANTSATTSSSDEVDPSHYTVGNNFIHDLIIHFKAINDCYDTLPASPSPVELEKGYCNLCSTKFFRLKSKSSMFPYARYKRHFKIRHDITNVARVEDDRQVLRCMTCP